MRTVLVDRCAKTVLFATHDLAEARELSDRVVLICDGSIAAQGEYADVAPALDAAFAKEADAEDAEFRRLFPELAP